MVIIGAGPAGLSCALWLVNQGYRPVVLECAPEPCGMLRFNHHPNDWLLGFPDSTGQLIGDKFLKHIQAKEINLFTSAKLLSVFQKNTGFEVRFEQARKSHSIDAQYLVLAAGTRPFAPTTLEALSIQCPEYICIGAGALSMEQVGNKTTVAVLGGGDNAFENAYQLAQRGVQVAIYCRANISARHEWVSRCVNTPNIVIYSNTVTEQFLVSQKNIHFLANEKRQTVDYVVVMYGYQPNTDTLLATMPWLQTTLNDKGFIKVNTYQQTTINRLYAVGDISDLPLPCLPAAIGQGSVAAKAIALDTEGMLP